MRMRYKIVNKKRFFLCSTMFLTIILIFMISTIFRSIVYSTKYETKYIEITIEEGDTLWDIVSKYIPNVKNKQRIIFEINKLNNIGNNHIYPGDIIKIPIQ